MIGRLLSRLFGRREKRSAAIENRLCPDCGGFLFRPGPRGGISQNIECVGCGTRLNVTKLHGEWAFAQRIPSSGEWREDMFPKVLQ